MINRRDKDKYEEELFESENEVAMSGELQSKKQAVDMFEKMVSPEYQEERRIQKVRKEFVKKKIILVGL